MSERDKDCSAADDVSSRGREMLNINSCSDERAFLRMLAKFVESFTFELVRILGCFGDVMSPSRTIV